MDINSQLLFFFSALGAFNGFLLSLYFLFFARPKHLSSRFLGGLLFMLSIRIGKSVFYYFNDDLAKVYLQIGLGACFLIGPFLYLYVKSVTSSTSNKNHWQYIIPFFLLLFLVVGYFYPYETNPRLWGKYFYKIINYQWLGFILLSAFLLRDIFKKIFVPQENLNYQEVWTLSIFLGVFTIWFAYFMAYFTSYIVGALSFSFVLYASLFVLIAYRGKKEITPSLYKQKYANRKIIASDAQALSHQIEVLMDKEELYKDPNLSLTKLAKKLNVSTHHLSQLLNDNLNKSFSQFINEYRIEEAKRILKTKQHLKMEIIAEHCGFNSNSTFYTAFKKFTNTTPAKYINNH